jgi:hypothetical protein
MYSFTVIWGKTFNPTLDSGNLQLLHVNTVTYHFLRQLAIDLPT